MKTVGVRDLQHRLRELLDLVASGETLVVKRRDRAVARIVPYSDELSPEPWPDLQGRLRQLYGARSLGDAASASIYRDRNE
jgi:antitoxin (DNA-binding transcriptional repressor) of toxin-antitoxin stability system